MQKFYCYVDESGQETRGEIFIVTVVVLEEDREQIRQFCEELEERTGKGVQKWRRSPYPNRQDYIREVLRNPNLTGKLMYSVFRSTRDYGLATVLGISKAIRWHRPEEKHAVTIYIDALKKSSRSLYSTELRKLGIRTKKVMGIRKDENDTLTRLADALAGFLRDALGEESSKAVLLFQTAKRKGILVEV